MIGHLSGTVRGIGLPAGQAGVGSVIISCGGVGYKVFATRETLKALHEGSEVALSTHLAVREDSLDLYGFANEQELRFFELLLTVPGIGPKSALGILDIAPVSTLHSAIATSNTSYLTSVSGIGKKTAEKIVLELKDKVGTADMHLSGALSGDREALEAMKSLGYSQQEARDALREVPATIEKTNDRLREALKILGTR